MNKTMRWISGIALVFVGLAAAAFFAFGGAFATVGCRQAPPDWAYGVMLAAGATFIAAASIPAVMLIRGAEWKRVVTALVLGDAFSCIACIAAFVFGMAPYC